MEIGSIGSFHRPDFAGCRRSSMAVDRKIFVAALAARACRRQEKRADRPQPAIMLAALAENTLVERRPLDFQCVTSGALLRRKWRIINSG
jgi:hypothetical protein